MPTLIARVDDDTKKRFKARAKRRGLKESEVMRSLVNRFLNKPTKFEKLLVGEPGKTIQKDVGLPEFLWAEVERRAEAQGMASTRWIAALVQSNLMHDPVMTEQQLITIRERNRELAALGRNLNQIARVLNDSIANIDRFSLDLLLELRKSIDAGKQDIAALVDASYKNWESIE